MQSRVSPAFRSLIEIVRADRLGDLAELALGQPVRFDAARQLLGETTTDELVREGWLETLDDAMVRLTVALHVFNGLVSVLPAHQRFDADFVHLNSDTFWLLDLIWAHAPGGDWACELGTGNGLVAAHLTAKYRCVVATDLPGPWMTCAQLTLEANEARGRSTAIIACDVARALRPATFELVVANTPWSPSAPLDDHGRTQTFMDGGPTGTELPSRFLCDAARLLAPGGVAILLCFDPTFHGGRRPLAHTLAEIESTGVTVDLIDSPIMAPELMTPALQKRLPDLRHARHVAAILHRR